VDGFEGFLAFDFVNVTLSIGSVYTALIDNDTVRWALASNQHTFGNGTPRNAFDYPGGDLILSGAVSIFSDATFKVLPITTPEPGSLLLLFIGLTGVFVKRVFVF
jgi:hypothetical protein